MKDRDDLESRIDSLANNLGARLDEEQELLLEVFNE